MSALITTSRAIRPAMMCHDSAGLLYKAHITPPMHSVDRHLLPFVNGLGWTKKMSYDNVYTAADFSIAPQSRASDTNVNGILSDEMPSAV